MFASKMTSSTKFPGKLPAVFAAVVLSFIAPSLCSGAGDIAKWQRFEARLESSFNYANAPQEAQLTAIFTSPKGEVHKVYGFWDGAKTWRLRFMPDETGRWTYKTICSDTKNKGLH